MKKVLVFAFLLGLRASGLVMAMAPVENEIFHVTEQTQEDRDLREKMGDLFFDGDQEEYGTEEQRMVVAGKAITKYNAQEVSFLTEDSKIISALYFKRSNSRVNRIYIDTYCPDGKEWCAPFAILHPEDNVLIFDLREFGDGEGERGYGLLGADAYSKDIQAAVDFVRQDNDKPIVLHGICFGGAMAMYTTLKARKEGKATADALGFSSAWKTFNEIFDNCALNNISPLYRLDCFGLFKKVFDLMTRGNSLFLTLNPIEMIEENIGLPCWFDHYTFDLSAPIDDAVELYEKTRGMKAFFQSDVGKHAFIHGYVPFQYRQAYDKFLERAGLFEGQQ